MVTEPLPDWMQKALLVGTYNDLPILVQIDSSGLFSGGLGAYADRYVRTSSKVSTGSDIHVDGNVVPEGELWIVTNIAVRHNEPIPCQVDVLLRFGTTNVVLFRNQFLLYEEVDDWQGEWVLKEGDYIRATFITPTNGKTGWLSLTGYKVEDLT